jgi:hypothetical protein
MSEVEPPLAHDISVCVNLDAIAAEPFRFGEAAARIKPLRRLEDGSLRSGSLQLAAGWSSGASLRTSANLQLMVLRGELRLGARTLGPNAFLVVPAGGVLPPLEAAKASEALLILDAGATLTPAQDGDDARVCDDVLGIEPITPVIAGRVLEGFERRVLWVDPVTGADTRLLRVPAGFQGAGPNWHPVNEEIFCLEGDIAPDDTRPMRAGSHLWNPARSIHGFNEHTRGGCLLLEWHDGPWALTLA